MSQIDYQRVKSELLKKYFVENFDLPPYEEPDAETLKLLYKYNINPKQLYRVLKKYELPASKLNMTEKKDRYEVCTRVANLVEGEYKEISKTVINNEYRGSSIPNETDIEYSDTVEKFSKNFKDLIVRMLLLDAESCKPDYMFYFLLFLVFLLFGVVLYLVVSNNKKFGYKKLGY